MQTDRFTPAAQRVASGSLGYGYRGLGALLGIAVVRELLAAMIGTAIMAALMVAVGLLSWGLSLANPPSHKPIAVEVALDKEAAKRVLDW